jgi:hypothetical protein
MPGLLVAIGDFPGERVRAAACKLAHVPTNRFDASVVRPDLTVGWAGQRERLDRASSSGEIHVWRYGHTFKDGVRPAPVAAEEILADYLARGVEACFEYEGSFVIVIADLRRAKVYVVPDRLCTQPLYYTRDGDRVVIGPEVKALGATLGQAPALSKEGVIGFLAAGYNVGAQTLFAGVERVELGKMLEIGLERPRKASARRFWKLDFGASEKLTNRRDAEDALFEAVVRGHRILLSDNPRFQILLSGGADSRAMLGVCSQLGVLPAKAVTWGLLPDTPRSDMSISRALAARFGVPWDFITTRTRDFVDNCEDWAYVSELANDNFGWYTEGFGALRYLHEAGFPCSFIGDESWGSQGHAYSERHAREKILPPTVPASVLALMPASERVAAAAAYEANLTATLHDCSDVDWNDRKDFLYLHGRVARFIFSLGYYRGHVTEHRRPFLTRPVLDVVRRLPGDFRVFKNVYRTMLKRRLPETMRVPYASVNSLPDWSYDLRTDKALKACFLDVLHDPLIESGALGEVLEVAPFRALRDAYFAEVPAPMVRNIPASQVLKAYVKERVWSQPAFKHLDRWMHSRTVSRPVRRSIADPIDILRRVAILVLLERQLHRFGDADYTAQPRREPSLMAG